MQSAKITNYSLLAASMLLVAACERPPIETTQVGYRGTAMVDVQNPRQAGAMDAYPDPLPAAPQGGPRAGDVYENVQVLGNLSVGEFTRFMTAITAWVSPAEGCNYCHNPANLASDDIYTKVVSRRMIQMTQHINTDWSDHVGANGVNCYTCHRGQNVPEYIWFTADDNLGWMTSYGGNLNGQNAPAESVGLASLPNDPYTTYLASAGSPSARVVPDSAITTADGASIQMTEATYGLMMNWSQSLDANCTYCHNTASFQNWASSTAQRTTAYHGLQMVKALNGDYLVPLQPEYPAHRLGELGDAPKAYCMTCHQGRKKPLGGADAVSAYRSLRQ